jgi:hypothetical protein
MGMTQRLRIGDCRLRILRPTGTPPLETHRPWCEERAPCHCEERRDEAISPPPKKPGFGLANERSEIAARLFEPLAMT